MRKLVVVFLAKTKAFLSGRARYDFKSLKMFCSNVGAHSTLLALNALFRILLQLVQKKTFLPSRYPTQDNNNKPLNEKLVPKS
jgi:hypothetical protein